MNVVFSVTLIISKDKVMPDLYVFTFKESFYCIYHCFTPFFVDLHMILGDKPTKTECRAISDGSLVVHSGTHLSY